MALNWRLNGFTIREESLGAVGFFFFVKGHDEGVPIIVNTC